ncbi:MAG: disulfide bond formation protein B [Alphaproteobacteria bacterium]|nr:disulfide bond formation protein B [Alphaproteobacteria bacterium]
MPPSVASTLRGTSRYTGLALALGSGAALLVALYFQYVEGLPPCPLCIDQRYAHGAAIAFALLAFAAWRHRLAAVATLSLVALADGAGAGIALFHVGVEQHWWAGPEECTGTVATGQSVEDLAAQLMAAAPVRCDAVLWSLFGVSMAGYNALLSAVLSIAAATGAALRARP